MALAPAVTALMFAASLASCSQSDQPHDAAVPDAVQPEASCEQMQKDYVSKLIASDWQVNVETTVHTVLQAIDFPQAMPYCSGDRPTDN
jgi:hypothetical protein